MFGSCLKPFVRSAVAVTAIASFSPTATTFALPGDPQAAAAVQGLSAMMEDSIATVVFQQRVSDYVRLHRLLEGPVPAPGVSTDIRAVQLAAPALAARIQAARKDARLGDIFTDEVARMFHTRLAACFVREEFNPTLAEPQCGDEVPATPRVNAVWPVTVPFDFVPAQLLAVLPPLPPELKYRIIGRSLVLWDHHANLIVDILPGALTPRGT